MDYQKSIPCRNEAPSGHRPLSGESGSPMREIPSTLPKRKRSDKGDLGGKKGRRIIEINFSPGIVEKPIYPCLLRSIGRNEASINPSWSPRSAFLGKKNENPCRYLLLLCARIKRTATEPSKPSSRELWHRPAGTPDEDEKE